MYETNKNLHRSRETSENSVYDIITFISLINPTFNPGVYFFLTFYGKRFLNVEEKRYGQVAEFRKIFHTKPKSMHR